MHTSCTRYLYSFPVVKDPSVHETVFLLVKAVPTHAATSLPLSTDLITDHYLNIQAALEHVWVPAAHVTESVPAKGVGYVNITLDGAVAADKEGDEAFRLFPDGHVHASTME